MEALHGSALKGLEPLDNYCGVNARVAGFGRKSEQNPLQRRAREIRAYEKPARLQVDATPQKSFGSREAIIHTRLALERDRKVRTSLK